MDVVKIERKSSNQPESVKVDKNLNVDGISLKKKIPKNQSEKIIKKNSKIPRLVDPIETIISDHVKSPIVDKSATKSVNIGT